MRRVFLAFGLAAAFAGCDPTIKSFQVIPATLDCPGSVTISWQGDADGARLQADKPVTPPLPATVLKKGMLTENVSETTTFHFFYPSAAQRYQTVTVTKASCAPCALQTLTFTGTCTSSSSGPSYITVPLTAALAPGNLTALTQDGDFPIHVLHAGQDIALKAGDGPVFPPLPVVAAAGDYSIYVPGTVGQMVCAGVTPVGGGSGPAPTVHLFVTPTCSP